MNFAHGQIWLINFDPSFGHEYQKTRPGLIVEAPHFISTGTLITVVPISSVVEKKADPDVLIIKTTVNRLMKDSLIKIRQISTFDKRRLIKFIGNADPLILDLTRNALRDYLAL